MSYEFYYAYLYGVQVPDHYLREEFDDVDAGYGERDVYCIMDMIINRGCLEDLPSGCPEKACDMDFIGGPDATVYIGYKAQMPYEEKRMSKEEMDENIHDLMVYLFGEIKAKGIEARIIDETWLE